MSGIRVKNRGKSKSYYRRGSLVVAVIQQLDRRKPLSVRQLLDRLLSQGQLVTSSDESHGLSMILGELKGLGVATNPDGPGSSTRYLLARTPKIEFLP